MEEYRDLYLTADMLCETLERRDSKPLAPAIALQAYIPDSDLCHAPVDRLVARPRRAAVARR